MTHEEFKAARAEIGLSLTEMAGALGVGRRHVKRMESGEKNITPTMGLFVLELLEKARKRAKKAS